MLLSFPWLFLSFVVYNALMVVQKPLVPQDVLNKTLSSFTALSGASWAMTYGDAITALTLVLLFLELLKSTRRYRLPVLDHCLAFVFISLCIAEFLLQKQAATSVFFIITLAALINLIAGLSLTKRANS